MAKRSKKKRELLPLPLRIVGGIKKPGERNEDARLVFEKAQDYASPESLFEDICKGLITSGDMKAVHDDVLMRLFNNVSIVYTISLWNREKQIFRFEPELLDLLPPCDETIVPVDVLKNRPCDNFFIEPLNVFVSFQKPDRLQAIQVVDEKGIFSRECAILKEGATVKEMVDIGKYQAKRDIRRSSKRSVHYSPDGRILETVLPAILYLCADNADIQESTPKAKRSEPMKQEADREQIEKQLREKVTKKKHPTEWDVGSVVVKTFNKTKQIQNSEEKRSGSSGWKQRPHMRRGHWHHFWTGKRSDPENRKLILKWVAPFFVGVGETRVVINEVKNR